VREVSGGGCPISEMGLTALDFNAKMRMDDRIGIVQIKGS
jgi:hypothetical protein